jgi:hypothetical protein
VERILDFGMECVGQFIGEPATRGLIDEGLNGGNESAVAGEPNRLVRPQAVVIEAGSFAEGIVATAMSIAGQVVQELEFAKDGEVGTGAESDLQLGQCGDFVTQEMLADGLGVERGWTHNDIVPTARVLKSELYHNSRAGRMPAREYTLPIFYGSLATTTSLREVVVPTTYND